MRFTDETAPLRRRVYIPDHLILTATTDEAGTAKKKIKDATDAINADPDLNNPGLTFVDSFEDPDKPDDPDCEASYLNGTEIHVYRVAEGRQGTSVRIESHRGGEIELWTDLAVLVTLNKRVQEHHVHADLSYATSVGGAPWTPMGSPWAKMLPIEEMQPSHPNMKLQAVDESGSPSDIARVIPRQWAMQRGFGLGTCLGDKFTVTGCESPVRVGVFDTSPWKEDESKVGKPAGVTVSEPFTGDRQSDYEVEWSEQAAGSARAKVKWVEPVLDLRVSWPAQPRGWPPIDVETAQAVKSHGLAVAGLLNSVARGADIHLYSVLQEKGVGDKYTTLLALDAFIRQAIKDRRRLRGAIINLSLGCHPPQDWWARGLPGPEGGWEQVGLTEAILHEMLLVQPYGPHSLGAVLNAAFRKGFVIIAAAGNDSANLPAIADAQIPASYPECLGVSSSNARGELSCFSNWGQVAAPGGDGTQDCLLDIYPDRYLVVPVDEENAHYALCAGTSFSTPLVSGLAALILDRDNGWQDVLDVPYELKHLAPRVYQQITRYATKLQCAPLRPVAVRSAGLIAGDVKLCGAVAPDPLPTDPVEASIELAGIASVAGSLEASSQG